MKYTKEQLQQMSNHSINALLAYLATGVDYTIYENQINLLNGDASMDYCNTPNDIMPLAFEHDVNVLSLSSNKWVSFSSFSHIDIDRNDSVSIDNCDLEIGCRHQFFCDAPLRAIACCLILVLQERAE